MPRRVISSQSSVLSRSGLPTRPGTDNRDLTTDNLFGLPYECQRACRDEIVRFSRQSREVFDALLDGPKTNADLAAICLKYTGRISDLRRDLKPRGWTVECYDQDRKTGLSRYRLARLSGSGVGAAGSRDPVRQAQLAALPPQTMAAIREGR